MAVARILLVKLSSLGDVVHTLPVVQDIHAAYPQAQIDWVLEKSFAPVLAHCPGVQRVIACDIRRWRRSFWRAGTRAEWRVFKTELQRQAYDAVIDFQGLTKSALVARLARLAPGGLRYALANQTEGSAYEAPTRWAADVAIPIPPHTAALQRARLLAAQALGYAVTGAPDFGLQAPAQPSLSSKPLIALIHGTSRADKEWLLSHWQALGQLLLAAGFDLALPHGNAHELATSQALAQHFNQLQPGSAQVWPRLDLAAVVEHLAGCAGMIGVDSGLSHIAVALDLPHVQLYNLDTAWRTGPTGPRQCSVFAQPAPTVDAVWQAWCDVTGQGA